MKKKDEPHYKKVFPLGNQKTFHTPKRINP